MTACNAGMLFFAGRERPGEFPIWKWANEQNLCFDHSVWSLSPKKKYQLMFHMFKKGRRWDILLIYKRVSMISKIYEYEHFKGIH